MWLSVFGFSLDECRKAGCEKPYHYFKHYVDSAWLRAHPSHSFALEALLIRVSVHWHTWVGQGPLICLSDNTNGHTPNHSCLRADIHCAGAALHQARLSD